MHFIFYGSHFLTLFDSRSTQSFIYTVFVSQAKFVLEPLLHEVSVCTTVGVNLIAAYMVKDDQMIVLGINLEVDQIVVDVTNYDVTLGMHWLAANHINIDSYKKEVVFTSPSKARFKFKGTCFGTMPKVILMMKAKKLVQHGT